MSIAQIAFVKFAAVNYGVATLSLIPCRAEAADSSEMTTQLLFGDHFEILEQGKKWSKISIAWDGYECFVDNKQISPISAAEFETLNKLRFPQVSLDLVSLIRSGEDVVQAILLGSHLPNINNANFQLAGNRYKFEGSHSSTYERQGRSAIVENAFMYLQTPYLWGGKSPFGIDCSGFVQMVFKLSGYKMPRDAWQQAEMGETLSFVEEALPGDLAFFDNQEGKIIHVGILLQDARIIHASGKVRIDKLDHHGIFNQELGTYTHNLRLIKRSL